MSERKIILKNTATGEEMVLPITPPRYPMATGRAVERLDMAQTGQMALPGLKTLFNEPLEFMLPARAYPEMTSGAIPDPTYYLGKLAAWSNNAQVCRYVVAGTDINSPVLLGPPSWEERDGTNDVYCTLPLYEYRFMDEVQVEQTGNSSRPVEGSAQAQTAQSYTVVRGDSLWAICRKFYGDGSLAYKLAEVNDIQNPNLIYPDQVLQMPDKAELTGERPAATPQPFQVEETASQARAAARSAIGLAVTITE